MVVKIFETGDSHYYVVMAWKTNRKKNAPDFNERYYDYDKALKTFRKLLQDYEYAEFYESIGGKRKWLADTDDSTLD